MPSPSALVCHLPTPPLACPLPYHCLGHLPSLSLKDFTASNHTFQLYSFSLHTKPMEFNISSRNGINFHCFWLSFDCASTLPSPSALVCHLPTPPLACPLPYPHLGHLPSLSLNLFTAQNMACHSCSHLSHMKRIEFNFLSLSSDSFPLNLFCL